MYRCFDCFKNHELTEREKEILKCAMKGKSNREIGGQLFISLNTVKIHLSHIFEKLGVSSRTEAAVKAVQNNLIDV